LISKLSGANFSVMATREAGVKIVPDFIGIFSKHFFKILL